MEHARPGYQRLGTVFGVPVFAHWSLPVGGVSVALLGGARGLWQWFDYAIAYALLVGAHEAGHALAARWMGLGVAAVELSGTGGLCRSERPARVTQVAWLYAAGLLVQAVIFLVTLAWVAALGWPGGRLGRAVAFTFLYFNVLMFVLNAAPQRDPVLGEPSDGWVLWRLWRHARRGHPHPCPPLAPLPAGRAPVFSPDTRLLARPGFRPMNFVSGVELLADRTTPPDFLVAGLTTHLGLSPGAAVSVAAEVHHNGGALVGFKDPAEAHRRATAFTQAARARGLPLVCRYAGPPELLPA